MERFGLQLPGIFARDLDPDEHGLVALGGELSAALVVEAYINGVFPWTGEGPIPWFSPDPRLVLVPKLFHRSKSLKKLIRKGTFETRFDDDFTAVIHACANKPRPGQDGTWITPNMIETYTTLFDMGIAHCVSTFEGDTRVGGLYGLTFGRTFFGESMFAHRPNASKVALSALCAHLEAHDFDMLDCQQVTAHLQSLGATAISRAEFIRRLHASVLQPSLHVSWAGRTDLVRPRHA